MASLSLDERFTLVRSVGEECIQEDELRNLLLKKKDPVCYDGFEPSGRMHIAQVRAGESEGDKATPRNPSADGLRTVKSSLSLPPTYLPSLLHPPTHSFHFMLFGTLPPPVLLASPSPA